MKKAALILTISIGSFGILDAQDIHFSQMPYSPLVLNPALAGANHDVQAIVINRSQWRSVASPYKTIGASCDIRLNKKRSSKGFFGAGLNFFNDIAGDVKMNTTNVMGALAYHVRVATYSTLGAAIYGGFNQRKFDPTAGKWASQYDGLAYNSSMPSGESFTSQTFGFFDAGAGIVYTYGKDDKYMTANNNIHINAGYALFHANRPKFSFITAPNDKLYMRNAAFANSTIGIGNSRLSLMPGLYYNQQGKAKEILLGSYVTYRIGETSRYTGLRESSTWGVGLFYRAKDAAVIKAFGEWKNYSMGFAYDINVSSLTEASSGRGGYEIFLRFVLPSPYGGGSRSRI